MKKEGYFCDNCETVMKPKEIFFGLTSADELLIGTCQNRMFSVKKQVGIHFCSEKCLIEFVYKISVKKEKEKTIPILPRVSEESK